MPTPTTFTAAEWTAFAADGKVGERLALAHGYTNPEVQRRHVGEAGEEYVLTIDETDDQATITTNLTAASVPTALTSPAASKAVVADGAATVTFDLDGQADKVVDLKWSGELKVGVRQVTLDGSGDGSFTVGPYASGAPCTDEEGIKITCEYVGRIAKGVVLTLKIDNE